MQKKLVQLIDDLDDGPADETVLFGLDGRSLEIDLSTRNAARLRDSLEPYRLRARRVGGRKVSVRKGTSSVPEPEMTSKNGAKATAPKATPKAKAKGAAIPDAQVVDAKPQTAKTAGKKPGAPPAAAPKVTFLAPAASDVRMWARKQGIAVSSRGRVPEEVMRAFEEHSAPTNRRSG